MQLENFVADIFFAYRDNKFSKNVDLDKAKKKN